MGHQPSYQRPADDDDNRLPVRGTPGGWVDCFDDVELTAEIARVRAAQAAAEAQARALAKRRPASAPDPTTENPPRP
jgi:hypothetical protein